LIAAGTRSAGDCALPLDEPDAWLAEPEADALPDAADPLPEVEALPDAADPLPEVEALPDAADPLPDADALPDGAEALPLLPPALPLLAQPASTVAPIAVIVVITSFKRDGPFTCSSW
jgi:hypothetical protein